MTQGLILEKDRVQGFFGVILKDFRVTLLKIHETPLPDKKIPTFKLVRKPTKVSHSRIKAFSLIIWGFPFLRGEVLFQIHSKGLYKHPNDSRNHPE